MKTPVEYVVAIVLDPRFGSRLREIAAQFDLWVVPSVENRAAVEELRREDQAPDHPHALTIWSHPQDLTSEATWLSMLDDIELHHGEYSHDPPVTTLEVFGFQPNDAARKALAEHEYTSVKSTVLGFRASRLAAV